MPFVVGANKLPDIFSSEQDLERLGQCVCASSRFDTVCLELGLGVERCRDCGLVRSNPRLTQDAIRRCYEDSASSGGQSRTLADALDFPATYREGYRWRRVSLRYRSLSKKLRGLFPGVPSPRLLEIGFGGGEFLPELRTAGFDVQGFDVSESAVRRLISAGIAGTFAPSLAEARFPDESFDMVVTWEVFEHIPNPDVFAREIRRILKPGGMWFLQVPNWRWIELKLRVMDKVPGRKSYLSPYGVVGPLFHLFHYTHETLKKTLRQAGLEYRKSFHIRLYDETRWQPLLAHEILFLLSSIPAILTKNRRHWNVILAELYQRPQN